jgi:hypothetical protein
MMTLKIARYLHKRVQVEGETDEFAAQSSTSAKLTRYSSKLFLQRNAQKGKMAPYASCQLFCSSPCSVLHLVLAEFHSVSHPKINQDIFYSKPQTDI